MRKLILLSLFAFFAFASANAQTPEPQTPAECVAAVQNYPRLQAEAARKAGEKLNYRQYQTDAQALAQKYAAKFTPESAKESELIALAQLYTSARQPDLASAAVKRRLALTTLTTEERAVALIIGVNVALSVKDINDEVLRQAENFVAQVDALPGLAIRHQLAAHRRIGSYYSYADMDAKNLEHHEKIVALINKSPAEEQKLLALDKSSAYQSIALVHANRGQADKAVEILKAAAVELAGTPNAVQWLSQAIQRYSQIGQPAPAIKAMQWINGDANGDGWPDLFVANDTQPNKLYRNNKNGTFTDQAMGAGVAYSEDGVARGAMGADSADYDRSGRPHLLVGNFSNQMLGLYHNEGTGLFVDEAPKSTVGRASLLTLAFGVFFFDYDLDGYPDILAANGHIEEEIGKVQPRIQYKEPPLLFRNLGQKRFENATASVGAAFSKPIVGRGAVYADIDHDGDLDVLFTSNHGAASLYRNDGGNANNWIAVRTRGVKSNRDGIGAVVRVTSASGKQWSLVRSGSSYASQSDLVQTFGLGKDAAVASIDIEWPSGARDHVANPPVKQVLTIEEGRGLSK